MVSPLSPRPRAAQRVLALSAASILSLVATPALANGPLGGDPVAPQLGVALNLRGPIAPDTAAITARFGDRARAGFDADGRLHALRRLDVRVPAGADEATFIAELFATHRDLFGLGGADAQSVSLIPAGREALAAKAGAVLRFDVAVNGVRFERRSATARLRADGTVAELRMDPLPRRVAMAPSPIAADAARTAVIERFGLTEVGRPTAVIAVTSPDEGRLAWRVPVALVPLVSHHLVWVDAATGGILGTSQAGFDQPHMPLTPTQTP